MNSTTIFLLVALILALIALAVAVLAFLKAQKALEKTKRDRIDRLARKTFDQQFDMFYGQKIKNLVHDEFVKQQAKPASVAKDVASVPSSQGNDSSPTATEAPEKRPVEIPLPEPVTIYTGSYRTGSFRHTTLTPDEKTIFTITAESKDAVEGVLNIDINAFDKIILTPDYLEGACTYSGSGSQLRVIQPGTVSKENGSWVVKEPIIAEFK